MDRVGCWALRRLLHKSSKDLHPELSRTNESIDMPMQIRKSTLTVVEVTSAAEGSRAEVSSSTKCVLACLRQVGNYLLLAGREECWNSEDFGILPGPVAEVVSSTQTSGRWYTGPQPHPEKVWGSFRVRSFKALKVCLLSPPSDLNLTCNPRKPTRCAT